MEGLHPGHLTLRRVGVGLALAAVCGGARADRLITEEGRVLEVKRARPDGDGYRFEFEHGTIVVPDRDGIALVEIEGDMSDYVPANDDEREKLEKGYVRYRGKWLSKPAYENELRKVYEASRERAAEIEAHSHFANGWELETRHFLVKSNTSPEILAQYGELFEAYYKLMDKRVGIKPTPELRRTKMAINIYKNREEFRKETGVPRGVAGFFSPFHQSLNLFHDYDNLALGRWVALHECTHLLTYLIDPQYAPQIWLNEGVADYFGSAQITYDKKGRPEIEPGALLMDRVLTVQQAMRDEKALDVYQLMHTPREDFGAFHYAHAWSFIYFLNEYDGGKYQKKFTKFFRNIYTTAKGVEYEYVPQYNKQLTAKVVSPDFIQSYLLKQLGVSDLSVLDRQWKNFVGEIPVDAPEALLKRGIRYVQTGDYEDALADLDAAVEAGLERAEVFANRARARLAMTVVGEEEGSDDDDDEYFERIRERLDKARGDFERAIFLDPLNGAYRYELSRLIVRTGGEDDLLEQKKLKFDDGEIEDAEARAQAGLAVELYPENPRFQTWLAKFK